MRGQGTGLPEPLEPILYSHGPQILDIVIQDLLAQLGFCLDLVPPILDMCLVLPFAMGIFTLCHFILDNHKLILILTRAHNQVFDLRLKEVFQLEVLGNDGTINIRGALGMH